MRAWARRVAAPCGENEFFWWLGCLGAAVEGVIEAVGGAVEVGAVSVGEAVVAAAVIGAAIGCF